MDFQQKYLKYKGKYLALKDKADILNELKLTNNFNQTRKQLGGVESFYDLIGKIKAKFSRRNFHLHANHRVIKGPSIPYDASNADTHLISCFRSLAELSQQLSSLHQDPLKTCMREGQRHEQVQLALSAIILASQPATHIIRPL